MKIFVVHYNKLVERKINILNKLNENNLQAEFVEQAPLGLKKPFRLEFSWLKKQLNLDHIIPDQNPEYGLLLQLHVHQKSASCQYK